MSISVRNPGLQVPSFPDGTTPHEAFDLGRAAVGTYGFHGRSYDLARWPLSSAFYLGCVVGLSNFIEPFLGRKHELSPALREWACDVAGENRYFSILSDNELLLKAEHRLVTEQVTRRLTSKTS